MVIGEEICAVPTMGVHACERTAIIKRGKVVYIHPLERFYTLEFEGKVGNYRESYIIDKVEQNGNKI